jgi:TonB family protein
VNKKPLLRVRCCVFAISLLLSVASTLAAGSSADLKNTTDRGVVSAPSADGPKNVKARMLLESCERPDYPPGSIEAGESGLVLLEFLVGVDGKLLESNIKKTSGFVKLDEAARLSLSRCKFSPAHKDGVPIQSTALIEYLWQFDRARVIVEGCEMPEYPPAALRAYESGLTVLAFLVDASGNLLESQVRFSSGSKQLDNAAKSALSLCKFKPAHRDGQPIQSWMKIEYKWQIDEARSLHFSYRAVDGERVTNRLSWSYALDRSYEQLSVQERVNFLAAYEMVKANDEPPFPIKGLGAFYYPMAKAQEKLNLSGELIMEISIDVYGDATKVQTLSSPSDVITKFATQLAMLIKFKPAKCDGKPCVMDFPLRILFVSD